ncbi:MAG: glycosyltransferase family 2 protein [Anaerolineales bacterium]
MVDEASISGTIDLSIVLVCWNNRSHLEACLDSLCGTGIASRFDIVVVDNGSTDGSQKMLSEEYSSVLVIQNDHNVGLGRASNQGIDATNGRYILLLNNDTIVHGPSIDELVRFADATPGVGAVGGRLLNEDGSFQAGFGNFPSFLQEFLIATRLGELSKPGYPSHLDDTVARKVDWLSSACLLVRRSALDEVGLLDEEYFIYGDETDLQYRLKQAGWDVYYLPEVSTIHFGGRSLDRWKRRRMVYRGKVLFFKKSYGRLPSWGLRLMLAALSLAKCVVWATGLGISRWRDRAQQELRSNIDVLHVCWNPSAV